MQSPCDTEWITTSFVVTRECPRIRSSAAPPAGALSTFCTLLNTKKCLKVLVQALPVSDIYLSEKQNYIYTTCVVYIN